MCVRAALICIFSCVQASNTLIYEPYIARCNVIVATAEMLWRRRWVVAMADCATHARLGHITALKNGLAFFDFLHFFIIVLCLWKKVFLGGIQSHVICISTDWSVLEVSEVARVRRNKFCSHMMSTKWKKINLHKNHCLVAALPAPLPPQPPSIIWLKLQ